MFGIFHKFDVDGGFGDAVPEKVLLFVTESESVAKRYVKKWSRPEVYDTPYHPLYHGELVVEELPFGIGEDELTWSPLDLRPELFRGFYKPSGW